ncbi:40s ribosomal protein s4-3 [Quercus suber]|uniref:40s ribosomal protein s4-3 n=1 Tax=Quercus suber TaxID=58331 RepID=A0AAW0IP33_QUESU
MRRHRTQQANRANEPTNERLGFLPTNAGADEPRRRRACSSPNPSVFLRLLVGVAGFVGQNRRLGSSARNPGARSLVTARNPGARSSFVGHARRGLHGQRPKNEARGLKKHLKRLNAPKHWMLDKLGGAFAPKPSSGPHKSRECLPLILILRNRLKYALTYREVISILMQRHVLVDAKAPKPSSGPHKSRECLPLILILRNRLKYALTYREVISILMQRHVLVDAKVRTDKTYPAGFMDVVSIPKTNENFRLLYDTKGRFRLHSIRDEEAKFKLCKVRSVQFGQKGIPYLNTYDGRTIRYPDPIIKANDTIKLDLETGKITDFIKFDVGNVVMVTGGRNRGRVGVIKNREKHKGTFETVHIQDATGHEFATRLGNVYTIGKGTKPWVSLPKGKGIKLSIIEEAKKRLQGQQTTAA